MSPALAQQNETFSNYFSGLSQAVTPLSGTEPVMVLQNGLAKKATISSSLFTSALVKPTTDGQNNLFQNGNKSAFQIYGPSAPVGLFDYDNIRSVIDIEPGTLVQNYNAYGAWIWNNTPDTSTCGGIACPAAVGLETFCVNAAVNAQCFGLNPAITDSYDGSALHSVASAIIGMEVDLMTANAGTTGSGISVGIQGPTQAGIDVLVSFFNPSSTARFSNGLALGDGSIGAGGAGLILGSLQVASGTNISSAPIAFNIFDSSGTEHHIFLGATPNATASQVVLSDTLSVNGFTFSLSNAPQIGASGASSNINLTIASKGASGGVSLLAGNSNYFDCNISFAGYCTVTSANGLAMNNNNIVQINSLSFSASIVANGSTGVTQTCTTNKASTLVFTLGILTGGTCNS